MQKRLILFLSMLLLLPLAAEAGPRIIWLTGGKGKDTFERGFSKMQDKLAAEKKKTQSLLWDVLKIYADDQRVTFDDKTMKIIVKMHGRASKQLNTNTNCQALATKARTVLFGSNPMAALLEYFPGIKQDDLRYFVYLHGTLDTYAVKDAKGQEELDPKDEPDPKKTVLLASTKCRVNAISDKTYFD